MLDLQEKKFYLDTLKRIVSPPTAPFHEENVYLQISRFLEEIGVPYKTDRWGNLIAHYSKGSSAHSLALMAHTDHPAFELVEPLTSEAPNNPNWLGKLLGGVPSSCFSKDVAVKIFPQNSGEPVNGQIRGFRPGNGPREIFLEIFVPDPAVFIPGDFGIWHLPDFELIDGFIHARAIDDLVGCAAALLTLWKLATQKLESDVYGIFTRAEEVGLVGANLFFQSDVLPRSCFVLSLEASKTLPGALQGEGPVIRVGDRSFTFDERAEFLLRSAADHLGSDVVKVRPPQVKIQRQLMSGGRCEAGAALKYGYKASGLAFPLGNYHNVAPDFSLQMENIHEQDFLTGVELLQQTALLLPDYTQLATAAVKSDNADDDYANRLIETALKFKQI